MLIPIKAKFLWDKYETRKDRYHRSTGNFLSHYAKKEWRQVSNVKVRHYKRDIPNGNWYRRIYDLQNMIW